MSRSSDDALESALERLPRAVLVFDHTAALRPFNARGRALFKLEGLVEDLVRLRPSHPLSILIRGIVDGDAEAPDSALVEFPGGQYYEIESSRRSEKGRARWLLLLIEPAGPAPLDAMFERWQLTSRESEITEMFVAGATTEAICERLAITPHTLKTHVRHLLEKSHSRNRTELLSKLLRRGSG
ncbi:MAG TPA: helix-turn-helix transcriptional regulator [Thermoanaerobaculia bacterium]